MLKRRYWGFLVISLALLTASPATAGTVWDMALAWPPTNFHVQNAQKFAAAVKEITKGELEIKLHPGGALGYKGPEMLSVLRDGLVPIGQMLTTQLVGEEKFWGIEAMPYLAPGLPQLIVLQKFSRPVYERLAAKHNQKILYMCPWPGQKAFTKKKINTLADLAKVKIRTVDKNSSDFFRALGASPIQMPWGEVVPALASGALDGVSTSGSSGVDGKFWEFLKYASDFNWHCSSDMVTVNLGAWKKLSPEMRAAIEAKANEMEPMFWKNALLEDQKSIEILTKNGIEVSSPSVALKAELIKRARPIWDSFMATVPESKPVIEDYLKVMGQ